MANYCSNVAVFTGDSDCVGNVLVKFAGNLRDAGLIEPSLACEAKAFSDVRESLAFLHDFISANYVHAFSSNPEAKQINDSCIVRLHNCGSVWILILDYSTAWGSNEADFEQFFSDLPSGDYGIAFFHASEFEGFETISSLSCLAHGKDSEGVDTCESYEIEFYESKELFDLKDKYSKCSRSEISSLIELAKIEGICQWSELPLGEGRDEGSDAEDEFLYEEEERQINWKNPSGSDIELIDSAIEQTLEMFPWVVAVSGSSYLGSEENVEKLLPGEPLQLISDWKSQYFDPVGISVHTLDGGRIGNLDNVWNAGMPLDNDGRGSLACILPYIQAFAESVHPLSTRSKSCRHSLVTVRLEIADVPLSALFDDVHALLEANLEDRGLVSIAKVAM